MGSIDGDPDLFLFETDPDLAVTEKHRNQGYLKNIILAAHFLHVLYKTVDIFSKMLTNLHTTVFFAE
jgi:hypothetical protein